MMPSITEPGDAEYEVSVKILPPVGDTFIDLQKPPYFLNYGITIDSDVMFELADVYEINIFLTALDDDGLVDRESTYSFLLTVIEPSGLNSLDSID
jgi:hypothetical protein